MQGPPRQIKATNTRMPSSAGEEEAVAEHRAQRGEGYQAVATPSFTPGPNESPIMTWGELGATPVRLDEDGPGFTQPADSGPRFKIPERKSRDVVGHRWGVGTRKFDTESAVKRLCQGSKLSIAIVRSVIHRSFSSTKGSN